MKKQLLKTFSLLAFLLASFHSFSQTTVTILLSQGSGEDAYLANGTPSTNFGSHPTLGGNTWTCSGNLCLSRGLFKFDLSSIPAGATITNASLELFADLNWSSAPTTGGPNNPGYLSRVTAPWTESGVTWASQPATTSANQVVVPGSTSTIENYTLNVTGLVQDMTATAGSNYGFMLSMQDEVNYYKSLMFASSDNTVTARCPKLTVSYNTNSATTTSITLCQGNGEDAYLASGTPSTNFGSHPTLGGNTWTCSGNLCLSRGLFRFDLSSVPAGATITNASLQLFADLNWSSAPTTGGPNNTGYLSRVTSPWTESTVTWGTQPSVTTTNQLSVAGSTSTTQDYTLNVTNLVQDMTATAGSNYGFMLRMQDEVNYYKSLMFASSDNANASKCPVLVISYISPTGIQQLADNSNVSVFPNPFTDELTVKSDKTMKRLTVTDMLGKVYMEENVDAQSYTLSRSLPAGIYFLSVYDAQNMVMSARKIVKCN